MPPRQSLDDLAAFVAVARLGSFTRAAARLGVSQSALSHTLRALEERLGLRLLARTTRRVAPTEAGERLLATVAPRLDEIADEIAALSELRDRPSGVIRLVASEHAAKSILWPALERFLADWPDVGVELMIDAGLTDIVAQRFDAGVRLGEHLAKDMIAVPIGPELRLAVFASPAYFGRHPLPLAPQDLTEHSCINIHLTSYNGLYPWEFEKDGRELAVRVRGRLVFNDAPMVVDAALAGLGLGCLPEDYVLTQIAEGRLVRVMEDWCAPFAGYHLYYPSRRQQTPAFSLLVDALRYRAPE